MDWDWFQPPSGILVYGNDKDLDVTGLSGGGPLAGGASNIVIVESGASITTGGDGAKAILADYNNRIDMSGTIDTTGFEADGIATFNNNKIVISGAINTTGYEADGIYAYDNNSINVSGTVSTIGEHANGLYTDNNSNIDMSGTISTVGDGADGIHTDYNANIDMSGTISTGGYEADGIYTDSNANINTSGAISTGGYEADGIHTNSNTNIGTSGTISTVGDGADGIYANDNNSINMSGTISTAGDGSDGIYADDHNSINMTGTISTAGDGMSYLSANSGGDGIEADDNNSINVSGTISTSGDGDTRRYNRKSNIMDTGLIITEPLGGSVYGINAHTNNSIDMSGAISVAGDGAGGIYTGSSNSIDVSGTISTSGAGTNAIIADESNSIDMSGTITTYGDHASGIYSENNNTIDVAGTISTSGEKADAILVDDSNSINVAGAINTSGEDASGIYAYTNNSIDVSGTINTSGNDSYGLVTGSGSNIELSGIIKTIGDGAGGIYNYGGNNIDISGTVGTDGSCARGIIAIDTNSLGISGAINTSGGYSYGIHAENIDSIEMLGTITTSGDNAYGIDATGSNSINVSGTITTSGDNADGLVTYNSDSIKVSGTINTSGDDADGLYAYAGSIEMMGAIITSGDDSDAIIANYFSSYNISGGVTTSGDGATGLIAGYNNNIKISGTIDVSGSGADGIHANHGGNAFHISGSVSALGDNSYALHSDISELFLWGNSYQPDEENIFHLLDGTDITGGIHNGDAEDNATAYLTFGYAKDENNKTDISAVDTGFNLTLDSSITSDSEGLWDAYFAGGTTTLNGTSNEFRDIFLGASSFNGITVPDGTGGAVTLNAVDGASANLTVTNAISTDGRVTIGTGSTYTLSGTHTHTGTDVTVNGRLNINGGTFNNNGSGGVTNNGIVAVAPGNTGTISGDYTQTGNGTIQVGATSGSNYGKLMVSGTADLSANNAIKVYVTPNDTLAKNDALNKVLSAGVLVVDEAQLKVYDTSAMWKFIPTVNNNTVDLTVLKQVTCVEAIGDSRSPHTAAASVIDGLFTSGAANMDMQAMLNEIGALSTNEQVAQAVAQTVPALAGATTQIGFDLASNGATQVVNSRLGSFSGLSAGDTVFEDRMAWVKPYYSKTDQDERNGIEGYGADTYGLVIGADGRLTPAWRIGAALSYGTADVESDSAVTRQQIDIETWQATLYANNERSDTLDLNLIGAFGLNNNESQRIINFGNVDRTAIGDYDSWHALLDGEVVKTYQISKKLSLGTSLALQYIYTDVGGYTESGAGALNLEVKGTDADSLVASLGGKLSYSMTQNQKFISHLDIGYDFLTGGSSLVSTYMGGGPSFVVRGNEPDEIVYRGGLGYELTSSSGIEIAAHYRVGAREDFINQTGYINLRFPF